MPTADEPGWRDDPGWRLVEYDPGIYSEADLPEKPTDDSELCNPPLWASRIKDRKVVATWMRPVVPSESRATVVVEDGEDETTPRQQV